MPVSAALREYCAGSGRPLHAYALFSGEEYELLFAMDIGEAELRAALDNAGLRTPVTCIGSTCDGQLVWYTDEAGRAFSVSDLTFSHFSR